jgi:acyl-CoA reductase-like NAD-dependent aldehyde dehydrogenase
MEMLRRVLKLFDERADYVRAAGPDRRIAGAHSRHHSHSRTYEFQRLSGRTLLAFEPVGVCALITPWNFPVLQIVTKVMLALATGCTIVLKPSEYASISSTWEEMLGPVVSLIPFDGADEAVQIAKDSPCGLAAYLQSKDLGVAKPVASKLRAGQVMINHPPWDASVPVGGFKQSDNGRECGEFGFEAFLEIKAIRGLHED